MSVEQFHCRVIVSISFLHITICCDIIEGFLAVSPELFKLCQVFICMFLKLKEPHRIFFNISVAKVVKLVTESLLNELQLLRRILFSVCIEFSCSSL